MQTSQRELEELRFQFLECYSMLTHWSTRLAMEGVSILAVLMSIGVVVVLHHRFITEGACVDPLRESILAALEASPDYQAYVLAQAEERRLQAAESAAEAGNRGDQERGFPSPSDDLSDAWEGGDRSKGGRVLAADVICPGDSGEEWHCHTHRIDTGPPSLDDDDNPVTSAQRLQASAGTAGEGEVQPSGLGGIGEYFDVLELILTFPEPSGYSLESVPRPSMSILEMLQSVTEPMGRCGPGVICCEEDGSVPLVYGIGEQTGDVVCQDCGDNCELVTGLPTGEEWKEWDIGIGVESAENEERYDKGEEEITAGSGSDSQRERDISGVQNTRESSETDRERDGETTAGEEGEDISGELLRQRYSAEITEMKWSDALPPWDDEVLYEFAYEYALLLLHKEEQRQRFNVKVLRVEMAMDHPCFGTHSQQAFIHYLVGYDTIVTNSLAALFNGAGYVYSSALGDFYSLYSISDIEELDSIPGMMAFFKVATMLLAVLLFRVAVWVVASIGNSYQVLIVFVRELVITNIRGTARIPSELFAIISSYLSSVGFILLGLLTWCTQYMEDFTLGALLTTTCMSMATFSAFVGHSRASQAFFFPYAALGFALFMAYSAVCPCGFRYAAFFAFLSYVDCLMMWFVHRYELPEVIAQQRGRAAP
mmetsp:Transcript_576/g.2020  ORF Transcript_576/g.2020 Transcript_576/m.2020 type:complete len:654 (+) Transcript_576:43-2004(+)|eukprot:CAMPEP_0114604718 /NCGR_PEP_ID=MMETSP0168-20121206/690_1 /TAXON_ID=95228 ORGANISM="Vannella sp., Strain DIVA3 517/6/12" /NCGR_SAMPLE_ID=MMETSP0168 /ASSEMBLY_ACC=CAM_ASM_000044 /LENGTH=653 /DNA_ID=CAMNT_0001815559 /DNA_START=18 /DNA_END=1979 /DNA_ORIENTATION=-